MMGHSEQEDSPLAKAALPKPQVCSIALSYLPYNTLSRMHLIKKLPGAGTPPIFFTAVIPGSQHSASH